MKNSSIPLYTASQARELDRLAIEQENIPGFTLMTRAAESSFQHLISKWPECKRIAVFCGTGNNGGDGYLIALIAHKFGFDVDVFQLGDLEKQKGDALTARQKLENIGVKVLPYKDGQLIQADVIVDALLGTGLERDVEGLWLSVIQAINKSSANVLSVDVPSGLHSDTGAQLGEAVFADLTVTYIARKQGLFTAEGKTCAGQVVFDSLNIPDHLYQQIQSEVDLLPQQLSSELLNKRKCNSHKGHHGHVLIVGGAPGMNGAVTMAARAALRTGCGLVSVATHPSHAANINIQQAEIMSHGVESAETLKPLMDVADVIILGPGLGQSSWSKVLFQCVIESDKPLVLDADALNILAMNKSLTNKLLTNKKSNWILTPHPGEAARLISCSTSEIQKNRFDSIKKIQKLYSSICVLKGAGTLIYQGEKIQICSTGNPGMASAGMGDVLSGVIGSLVAQAKHESVTLFDAVSFGVCLHANAGDVEARLNGEKGLLATDLLPYLRSLMNA